MIIGVGSASAMVTLRERTTQYGVIVNLPHDHTAASVNAAVTGAFTAMPAHMKRTLTWDQGGTPRQPIYHADSRSNVDDC